MQPLVWKVPHGLSILHLLFTPCQHWVSSIDLVESTCFGTGCQCDENCCVFELSGNLSVHTSPSVIMQLEEVGLPYVLFGSNISLIFTPTTVTELMPKLCDGEDSITVAARNLATDNPST